MKAYLYIVALALMVACKPTNTPTQTTILQADSVFTEALFTQYGEYYNSGHQVYAIDLLSEGLDYDSADYIIGSGYNLYLSDIFVAKDSTTGLPAGHYTMDSVAKEMTFLRGIDFEGSITGTYLLYIKNNQIEDITLFTRGSMTVEYIDNDTLLNFQLYTTDSTPYHATYRGTFNHP